MKRALRCFGYVLAGIAGVACAAAGLFAAIGALFWLSDATARWLDLPDRYGIVFVGVYFICGMGGVVGGIICREAAK